MKYLIIALVAVPIIAVAGLEYAVEIIFLTSLVAGGTWLIDWVEASRSDVEEGT